MRRAWLLGFLLVPALAWAGGIALTKKDTGPTVTDPRLDE